MGIPHQEGNIPIVQEKFGEEFGVVDAPTVLVPYAVICYGASLSSCCCLLSTVLTSLTHRSDQTD